MATYEIRLLRDKINYSQKYHNFHQELNSNFNGFIHSGTSVTLLYKVPLTEEQQAAIQLADVEFVDNISIFYNVMNTILIPARVFGQKMIDDFVCENILMGITQEDKTSYVRVTLREVMECLVTGSLYDAIAEVRAIPAESRDEKYLSTARLLGFINKVEKYLGIPLSTEL